MNPTDIQLAFSQDYTPYGISVNGVAYNLSQGGVSGLITNPVSLPSNPASFVSGNMGSQINLVTGFLQSSNFVTGVSGWQIDASGNAEFNAGTFRGALIANSIDIPNTTTANSFHVDNMGNTWWGATTFAAAPATVANTGAANFSNITISGTTLSLQNVYGDGSDGAATISVNTTLARDMFYTDLTINSGITLKNGSFRIFCTGTLTINSTGIIDNSGIGASGVTGGAAVASGSLPGSVAGKTGGSGTSGGTGGGGGGNVGANGTSVTQSNGSNGTAGGNSGNGGNGGSGGGGAGRTGGIAGTATGPLNIIHLSIPAYNLFDVNGTSIAQHTSSAGSGSGAGGPSGAGGGGGGQTGGNGGDGGGSGSSGGYVSIFAKKIVNNGTISSNGGAGSDGFPGGNGSVTGNTGGGGGGGGGAGASGGVIILTYSSSSGSGGTSVTGGTGGSGAIGGNGNGTGTNGATGTAGTTGLSGKVISLIV